MKLTVEKLVYGGDGLARTTPDATGRGKTVFVPFTLPGEEIDVAIVEEKPGFARAVLQEVLRGAPQRIKADCPHFTQCGGCSYQHTAYADQIKFKQSILLETLRRTAKIDWTDDIKVHTGEPWRYRNRARFHVEHGAQAVIGFHRARTNSVLAVRECPILSPLLERALKAVWATVETGVPPRVSEIEFFAGAEDDHLMAEVFTSSPIDPNNMALLEMWLDRIQLAVPELKGAGIFSPQMQTGADDLSWGEPNLVYRAAAHNYRVSAGSFFQTNRFLAGAMVTAALGDATGNKAWDLYAGVGLFTLPLLERFNKVLAVESSRYAISDLMENVRTAGRGNFRAEPVTVEAFLAGRKTGPQPDFIVLDPPRAGLGERHTQKLAEAGAARIAYVSCDPATLARDLRVLLNVGYKIREVHLIDLFPQTYHIESCVQLER